MKNYSQMALFDSFDKTKSESSDSPQKVTEIKSAKDNEFDSEKVVLRAYTPVEIIEKTKNKEPLTKEEVEWWIKAYTEGRIPDYQMSAWCMAVVLQGLTISETSYLTQAMAESGILLDLHKVVSFAVDKHSSGGVGDKTTLVVGPIVASCGIPVAKMSGRGLGYSGGTIDKLESIPGIKLQLSTELFLQQLKEVGFVISSQVADLTPADGKLYALRDVTGTINSPYLLASSIMSKKIATGADAMVLDVKVGKGAFVKTVAEARELAEIMLGIGREKGRQVTVVISDMNQPLGAMVGNSLEVEEAVATLLGNGPEDFTEHCLVIAAHMFLLSKKVATFEEGYQLAQDQIKNNGALNKFKQMVTAQGGNSRALLNPAEYLPRAKYKDHVIAANSGYIQEIDAQKVGRALILLGGGRLKKTDQIDYTVGMEVHAKVGAQVEINESVITIYANNLEKLSLVKQELKSAVSISKSPITALPLVYDVVTTLKSSF